jgi:hypothetical protein
MEDNIFEWISKSKSELEIREGKLIDNDKAIDDLLLLQNERLWELWKGYKVLGLVDERYNEEMVDLTSEEFMREYIVLEKRLESAMDDMSSKTNDSDTLRNKLEKCIADLMNLLGNRWWTLSEFKRKSVDSRRDIRNMEDKLFPMYEKLATISFDYEKTDWKKCADDLFEMHKPLIEAYGELLSEEGKMFLEFETIIKKREAFSKLAHDLF